MAIPRFKPRKVEEEIKERFKPTITIREIPFTYTIPASTGVDLALECPMTGLMFAVTGHWPDGCNALVDVALFYDGKQEWPRTGFIALNDATHTWRLKTQVEKTKELLVRMQNRDLVNPHTPVVIVSIEGEETP